LTECRCKKKAVGSPPGDGTIRVGRQTKGRKGKGVTVVTGVPLGQADLETLARDLKKRCGSGGTVRDGAIEIQGEHRDTLVEELGRRGFTVRRAGG
jgi:translation initiation factor 1